MKDKTTTGILALVLGGLGVHRFYLEQIGLGILYFLFCWTFIPAMIAFLEAFYFFGMTKESFDKAYNKLDKAS
jgi:TM2 domain-containing membrane protein YozV